MKPIPTVASNRRAHDRFPIRTDVTLQLPDGRTLPARTLDVGKGGMGIVVDINPPLGSTFHLRARLPTRTGGSVNFEARVVVANCVLASNDGGFRLGVQFTGLDAPARELLARCLP